MTIPLKVSLDGLFSWSREGLTGICYHAVRSFTTSVGRYPSSDATIKVITFSFKELKSPGFVDQKATKCNFSVMLLKYSEVLYISVIVEGSSILPSKLPYMWFLLTMSGVIGSSGGSTLVMPAKKL